MIDGKICGDKNRKDVANVLEKRVKTAIKSNEHQKVGQYRGFEIAASSTNGITFQFELKGAGKPFFPANLVYPINGEFSFNGFIQRMDNFMDRFGDNVKDAEKHLGKSLKELETAKQSKGQAFPQMELLEALRHDNRDVIREIQISQKDPGYKSGWKPKSQDLEDSKREREVQKSTGKTVGYSR